MFIPKRLQSEFTSFPIFNMVPEGAEGGSGGGGGEGDNGGGEAALKPASPPEGYVSKAELERALSDVHKYKNKAKSYESERETEKLNRMKEQNQWKEIAEAKELEAQSAREEKERIQNSFLGERKYNAVREKCSALGLRAEAMSDLEMLDLEAITIETTNTGKINVLGADKFAERLKTLKPHWFADQKAPTVNTNGTRVVDSDNGEITASSLLKAEAEGKKSGNMVGYQELFKKFQQQRANRMKR